MVKPVPKPFLSANVPGIDPENEILYGSVTGKALHGNVL
jgi:hypothetical protein